MDGIVRSALFTITCTTCHVRLAVRSAEAVGAILECPKCGCMVPVTPPDGWQPPKPPDTTPTQSLQSPIATNLRSVPGQGQGEGDSSNDISSADISASGIKTAFSRVFHSWYTLAAAPVAALAVGLVVWLTMFSEAGLDNSSKPVAEKTAAASNDAPVSSDRKDADSQASDQPAAVTENEATAQANQEPPESKTPEAKPTEVKAAEVNTPDVKASEEKKSVEEKNQPAKAASVQNKTPATPATETTKLVKLVAPEAIDVQSRLADVVPGIEFRDMPFAQAIGLAAALSGLPITIDPEAMALMQVSLRDPISLRMSGVTVEEILQEIVTKRGMSFTADDGQIVVTSPADQREKLRLIRYTVSDLTDGNKAATDRLANMVQKLVSSESWQSGGGQGTIETEKSALVVTQSGEVHDQILVFCEKLRNARGRPLKSNRDPRRFDLTSRLQQAGVILNREVTANFHEPATLVNILAYLGRQAEFDILLDRQALGEAGMSDQSEISFAVENRPLAAALNELLTPLKLGFRPIDAHTLQVSTQSALAARLELEFYPIGKILGKDGSAADLIERIKTIVVPASWNGAGTKAAIYFDQPSAMLIVLQSSPVQAAIQSALSQKQTSN